MLQYILSFIILISIVVFIHEYGHYYFAKKYKVGVTDFSIGFGKELFGFNDKDGTRWKICAIPLGGYVKFFGDSNSASQPMSLDKIDTKHHSKLLTTKPLYQRAIIVSAGPLANFILAIIIFSIIFMTTGKDATVPVITEVQQNSPASKAGLKSNDQITFIDDKKIQSINDVALFISTSENDQVKIEVLRNQQPFSYLVKPEKKNY
jgi:regulator of sigma E protease